MKSYPTLDCFVIDKSQCMPQGSQSTIYMVKGKGQKSFVAKIFDEEFQSAFRNELSALQTLGKHQNIIKMKSFNENGCFKNYSVQCQRSYLVLEYCKLGNLLDVIQSSQLREPTARFVFVRILEGLRYCHSKHIFHNDIKPDNILIKEKEGKCQIKIADFGLSSNNDDCTKKGSVNYMNPQMLQGKNSTGTQADFFGLGVLLYNMVIGKMPFRRASFKDEQYRTLITNPRKFWNSIENVEVSEHFKSLVEGMLAFRVDKRLCQFELIINHDWLRGEISSEETAYEELTQSKNDN